MSYGGYRRNDMFGPKPVESGKEYDVQVTEISRKGDGIARIQGFVIFVKDGKVGQNAKIRVTQVGNRFATAEIVDGSTASSETSSAPAEQKDATEAASDTPSEANG
ncbi:MAG TPA: TRAM domain-containing protein [Nitrososphaeraceae archaeon]|jgi:predicted RNA-binding protein with TRAM domain